MDTKTEYLPGAPVRGAKKLLAIGLLKEKSNAQKVTQIREVSPGLFEGNCLTRQGPGPYKNLGRFRAKAP